MRTVALQPASSHATFKAQPESFRADMRHHRESDSGIAGPEREQTLSRPVSPPETSSLRSREPDGDARDVVVGFDATDPASATALEKAIDHARADHNVRLVVVHASSSPVMVHNGPSPEIARAMGDPAWATVHSTVMDRGADPQRTLTVVEPGDPIVVLARHCANASVVYLGPTRRRFRRHRSLGQRLSAVVDCPVVQVADDPAPSEIKTRRPEPNSPLILQPGVTS